MAISAGFVSGMVASWLSASRPVLAQKKAEAPRVVEAEEFRLLDKDGRVRTKVWAKGNNLVTQLLNTANKARTIEVPIIEGHF